MVIALQGLLCVVYVCFQGCPEVMVSLWSAQLLCINVPQSVQSNCDGRVCCWSVLDMNNWLATRALQVVSTLRMQFGCARDVGQLCTQCEVAHITSSCSTRPFSYSNHIECATQAMNRVDPEHAHHTFFSGEALICCATLLPML